MWNWPAKSCDPILDWVSITLLCVTRYVDYSPPPVGIRRWKPYHVTLGYVIGAYHQYKDNRIDSDWKVGSVSCLLFCCMSGLVRKRSWKPLVRKGLQVRILCAALWLWQTWQCSGLWFRLIWVRIPLVTFICAFRIIGSTTGSNPVSQSSSLWGACYLKCGGSASSLRLRFDHLESEVNGRLKYTVYILEWQAQICILDEL